MKIGLACPQCFTFSLSGCQKADAWDAPQSRRFIQSSIHIADQQLVPSNTKSRRHHRSHRRRHHHHHHHPWSSPSAIVGALCRSKWLLAPAHVEQQLTHRLQQQHRHKDSHGFRNATITLRQPPQQGQGECGQSRRHLQRTRQVQLQESRGRGQQRGKESSRWYLSILD